jgi:hypothetical protein
MPFIKIPNMSGKFFVPLQIPETVKKKRCHDCFSCQMCSETRCKLCKTEESYEEKKEKKS